MHTDNLNLDVHLDELLRKRVDLDQTWIDGAVEATEFGDETDVPLVDGLVRVRADDTAWDGTTETKTAPEVIDYMS